MIHLTRPQNQLLLLLGLLLTFIAPLGCDKPVQQTGHATRQQILKLKGRESLLKAAILQLHNLPNAVNTVLRPPTVVLDASKSRDGKEIKATCTTNPNVSVTGVSQINLLTVPAGNAMFKANNIQPGDTIKYFIQASAEALEAASEGNLGGGESQFIQNRSIDLIVAQVLDNNRLIFNGSLSQAQPIPELLQIWRFPDERMEEVQLTLEVYAKSRQPVFGWEPAPDKPTLNSIVKRLNQWLRQHKENLNTPWSPSTLIETWPEKITKNSNLSLILSEGALRSLSFHAPEDIYKITEKKPSIKLDDGQELQTAIWLSDISKWGTGNTAYKLKQATALFNWTIKNIQLERPETALPLTLHQILYLGHGTAEQRAWVFAALCRQRGIDVVILTVPVAKTEANKNLAAHRFWLPAVLSDQSLYLFDTQLGLPLLPTKNIPLTLTKLQTSPTLLQSLSIGKQTYPLSKKQLAEVRAEIVATPFELSRRASLLQQQLSGNQSFVISVSPEAIIKRLPKSPALKKSILWDYPVQTLATLTKVKKAKRIQLAKAFIPFAWRPQLWKARVLHLQGKIEEQRDARFKGAVDIYDSHKSAIQLYSGRNVRIPQTIINKLSSAEKRRAYKASKQNATLWLSLLLSNQGKQKSALQWLENRLLERDPSSPWINSARYNAALIYEQLGEYQKAIKLLENDASPQAYGNLLRAAQLKASLNKTATPLEETPTPKVTEAKTTAPKVTTPNKKTSPPSKPQETSASPPTPPRSPPEPQQKPLSNSTNENLF